MIGVPFCYYMSAQESLKQLDRRRKRAHALLGSSLDALGR